MSLTATPMVTPDAIIALWHSDFRRYAEDVLKIQTKEGELIPFRFKRVQDILEEIIEDIKKKGRQVRLIILKARRQGMSTYFLGRYYHKCSMNFNRYACIITHEPDASDFLFGMTRRYHIHNEIRPAEKYNNRRELNFNNKEGTGLDSGIRVATAGKEDVGSSQLIHYLHLSEVAKWPAHTTEALLTSVMQCVPSTGDTEIVFESTAKGVGGEFHDRYQKARYRYKIYQDEKQKVHWKVEINEDADPSNEFAAIFIPWFADPDYQMGVPEGFTRTEVEQGLVDLHNCSDEQLAWRRWSIQNNCGGDLRKFQQEYPATDEEAFLSSGTAVFDSHQINMLRKDAPNPIMTYDISASTGEFIANKKMTGDFRVWKEPEAGKSYVMGIDVAEGLEKGDFSDITLVEQLTGEQVAQWHGKCDPDLLGDYAIAIGRRYNYAWACPERNNHGMMVVDKFFRSGYGKLWVEKIIDPPAKPRKRYGWLTSRSSKPLIIDNLIAQMREAPTVIKSRLTLDEMLSFKRDEKGQFGAEENRYDDCVMSMAIAQYCRGKLPLPAQTRDLGKFKGRGGLYADPNRLAKAEEPVVGGQVHGWLNE